MSPRRDLTFGSQAGLRAPAGSKDGSPEQRALVDAQMRRLRSYEDAGDTSETAVVYRELLAAADLRVRSL